MVIKRFEIYFASLDPTLGSEIRKTRPCLIVSPDEMNDHLNTVIIAPLTSTTRRYPTCVNCHVDGKDGQIALDQMRAIDKTRLTRKIGQLDPPTAQQVLSLLRKMFS
ncbi:transcriptional modulator of MazE/toxin, MazF [Dyadobacter soli]|uniref:mRNA interferase n=1 Tax=Dyadobacter soli TaxID=659014 RepID=A0A1G7K6T5_9BACT|nr:type II toxin-antitoxin system PemK/MazF family toxin [Dyadobacter soli]SDF32711.1 transcriptional modulator of MazE/toxin, MazF [Dyadobacter soli]